MTALLWTSRDVAEALGLSVAAFYRRVTALRRDHGFPATVPGLRARYDPQAISEWLARQRTPGLAGVPTTATDAELSHWQQELDRRADRLSRDRPPVSL